MTQAKKGMKEQKHTAKLLLAPKIFSSLEHLTVS